MVQVQCLMIWNNFEPKKTDWHISAQVIQEPRDAIISLCQRTVSMHRECGKTTKKMSDCQQCDSTRVCLYKVIESYSECHEGMKCANYTPFHLFSCFAKIHLIKSDATQYICIVYLVFVIVKRAQMLASNAFLVDCVAELNTESGILSKCVRSLSKKRKHIAKIPSTLTIKQMWNDWRMWRWLQCSHLKWCATLRFSIERVTRIIFNEVWTKYKTIASFQQLCKANNCWNRTQKRVWQRCFEGVELEISNGKHVIQNAQLLVLLKNIGTENCTAHLTMLWHCWSDSTPKRCWKVIAYH